MIIFLGICSVLFFIMADVQLQKRLRKTDNEPCEEPKPYKLSKKESLLVIMAVISLAMIFLISIAMTVAQALGADYNTTALNSEYIPIQSEGIKVYVAASGEVFFDDGYGTVYYIPKNTAEVKAFPDNDLRITSVTKETQRKTRSKLYKFLTDFGLVSSRYEEVTESYTLSVSESKVILLTPVSEAFSVQIAVPFEEES